MLFLIVQRYKFESKSQPLTGKTSFELAVPNSSKVQIWKQITTASISHSPNVLLFLIVQRYKFESKSQLDGCRRAGDGAVPNSSKVQIWKQITTDAEVSPAAAWLFLIVQRYKFESKSQPSRALSETSWAVPNSSKVQIWKQITTQFQNCFLLILLFLIVQRYKFESKSQRSVELVPRKHGCS